MTAANRARITFFIVSALVAGLVIALARSTGTRHSAIQQASPAPAAEPESHVEAVTAAGVQPLDAAARDLLADADVGDSRKILAKLRTYLLSLPKSVASRLIGEFLDQKRDAGTKLQFTLERNGFLSDAPTLRVFLLDLLAQIDPRVAGQYALQILSTPGSPDEWAVSLRNYALAGPLSATQPFMQAKLREMLANSAWRADPSAGYLEAFDTAVYTHDTGLTPALSQLMADKENRAVVHAAYLAMDRLVIEEPAAVLGQLEADPGLMQGHEQTRADYFARADAGEPRQKALLESYLLDPNRTAQELNTFAAIYPNENYMVSNNLLTQCNTPANADIVARDQQALAAVEGWMADPRFQALAPQLQTIHDRLRMFLGQAAAPASGAISR